MSIAETEHRTPVVQAYEHARIDEDILRNVARQLGQDDPAWHTHYSHERIDGGWMHPSFRRFNHPDWPETWSQLEARGWSAEAESEAARFAAKYVLKRGFDNHQVSPEDAAEHLRLFAVRLHFNGVVQNTRLGSTLISDTLAITFDPTDPEVSQGQAAYARRVSIELAKIQRREDISTATVAVLVSGALAMGVKLALRQKHHQ